VAGRPRRPARAEELTRRNDELARKRRELPWVPVEKEYSFETADGSKSDNLDANLPHLRARDVTMICSSRAPLDKLLGYEKRMGWSFDWVSTVGPTSTGTSASCIPRKS
jgi:predicted dithiol-disulfide oxidoreductase (DUF899 family)